MMVHLIYSVTLTLIVVNSFIVMPYKDGGIDMCLWGNFGSDYGYQYSYAEFLNMELIDEPKL
jgi:hypothetical protein